MSPPVRRLPWIVEREVAFDVVVIGSGAAGATAALEAAEAGRSVLVVTKADLGSGSTEWAQGGLAAVLDPAHDSVVDHARDTLTAGAGLGDEDVVNVLVREAPEAVRELQAMGARFDRDPDGELQLAREGGHARPRIVHSGGDATGAEVQRTLDEALRRSTVTVWERCIALDAVRDEEGCVAGVVVALVGSDGALRHTTLVRTTALVVATGGIGQAYASTTNPKEATGDGIALALRAGASVADVEFVQFHPTSFWRPGGQPGQRLLVSEAVRGEGAVLVDVAGARVMAGVHPLEDLAPRDVVATAIAMRLRQAPGGVDDHVLLDATSIGPSFGQRFPTIMAACRDAGIDPVHEPIPVAPAAHFACGGVRANLTGETSVPGLFAVGEVAATGVHGANRLASNGVTEGLVAGRLVGETLGKQLPHAGEPVLPTTAGSAIDPQGRMERAAAMSRLVGPLRDERGLATMAALLSAAAVTAGPVDLAAVEATNLHTVSWLIVNGARMRDESRGCHRRLDAPEPSTGWLGRIEQALADTLHAEFVPDEVAA